MSSEFLFKDGTLEMTLHNHEIQTPFISYVIFKAVPFPCPMTPANWSGPITLSEHCTGHLVCPSEDPPGIPSAPHVPVSRLSRLLCTTQGRQAPYLTHLCPMPGTRAFTNCLLTNESDKSYLAPFTSSTPYRQPH